MAKNPVVDFIKENLTQEQGAGESAFFECKTLFGGKVRIFTDCMGDIYLSVEDEAQHPYTKQVWILEEEKNGQ